LPTVTIGTVATDDAINYSEGHTQGGVPVSGTVTGLAGTAVTLTLTQGGTSKSYQTSITNGTPSAALSSTDLQALTNGSATLTAQAQDQYGNQSAPVTHAITVADTLPTVTIGTVATGDAINYSEAHAQGGVPVSGTVTGLAGTAVTLTLTQGGTSKSYQTSITNGTWSAALSSTDLQALTNGSATLTAQAQDQYGNQSAPVTHAITIADTLPTVTIDAVEGNDAINYSEAHAQGGVPV